MQPESINTSLYSTVNFTCIAAPHVDIISFIANGTLLDAYTGADKDKFGLNQYGIEVINGTKSRSLSVCAQENNNNTIISCITTPGANKSENAILKIQGKVMSIWSVYHSFLYQVY